VSDLVTVREELMAVAIGDLGALLDRMDTLAPRLDASQLALRLVSSELAEQVTAYEKRMVDITENAKLQAVKHIARRADEMARETVDTQTRAMEEAARVVFRNEVGPALQRVALPLQEVAALARRGARPWEGWLLHAATAVLSSAISWAMAAWLWLR
jgi:ABC-type transporter Mla subunit MlaD